MSKYELAFHLKKFGHILAVNNTFQSFFHLMLEASKNAATADAGLVNTQRKVKLEAMKKAVSIYSYIVTNM